MNRASRFNERNDTTTSAFIIPHLEGSHNSLEKDFLTTFPNEKMPFSSLNGNGLFLSASIRVTPTFISYGFLPTFLYTT